MATGGRTNAPYWRAWNHGSYRTWWRTFKPANDGPEDLWFLADDLLGWIDARAAIPPGRTVWFGSSNGASMAFRLACERPEVVDGLVILTQGWLDPWSGWIPPEKRPPELAPRCNISRRLPTWLGIGKQDQEYGPNGHTEQTMGEAWRYDNAWKDYSTRVLQQCTERAPSLAGGDANGQAECHEFASCANRLCEYDGVTHDSVRLVALGAVSTGFSYVLGQLG